MSLMESWYPQATAQPWDRVGLIVGDPDALRLGLVRVFLRG